MEQPGAKCGSTFIDGNFKMWLNGALTNQHYAKLDDRNASQKISSHATETGEMREVMKEFDAFKRTFTERKHRPTMVFDLPKPLENLTVGNKVSGGSVTITR
jgi:hypothetical protein